MSHRLGLQQQVERLFHPRFNIDRNDTQRDPNFTAMSLAAGNSPVKQPQVANASAVATVAVSTFVEIDVEDNADLAVLCNTIKDAQQRSTSAGTAADGPVDVGAYSVFVSQLWYHR